MNTPYRKRHRSVLPSLTLAQSSYHSQQVDLFDSQNNIANDELVLLIPPQHSVNDQLHHQYEFDPFTGLWIK